MPPEVLIPIGFFIFILCAWTINTYNKFVRLRNKIEESWSAIDVALKRRANLIPNLIRITEGYINHEARIFQEKNKISEKTDNQQRLVQENEISRSLGGLLALAEAYPELKSSGNFLDLQNTLDEIEQEIRQTRDRYNSYVSRLNTLTESFPASIIAAKFGFIRQNYLALEVTAEKEMPRVAFGLASEQEKK